LEPLIPIHHPGDVVSSQPNVAPAAPKATVRHRRIDHAEIVRMAVSTAASRNVERQDMIATCAYFRAQQRGFEPGHELEDWLAAESEVARILQLNLISPGAGAP
jgi:hypothetical protein